jgi:hypothetical protein
MSTTACRTLSRWCGVVGDRIYRRVQFLTDGDPWDLTGATVEAQVRATWDAATAISDATVTGVSEVDGVYDIEFDGEDFRGLVTDQQWEGVYDIQVLESGETRPETVERGTFQVVPDATRV